MQATKVNRRVKLSSAGQMTMTVGGVKYRYTVTYLPSDYGTAFSVTKPNGETYDVNLDGVRSSCTCKGNTYRHKCKHVDALAALLAAGKLTDLLF